MAGKPCDPELLQQAINIYHQCGQNKNAAARAIGLPKATYTHRLALAQSKGLQPNDKKPFESVDLPDDEISTEELLETRIRQFERRRDATVARKLIPITVKIDGPIGIVHFGDPHVDDDGTDLGMLREHVKVVNQTEGLFGANLGDLQNAWIGRLARLWAEQSTNSKQAWRLVEWLVRSVDWLYLVAGNHDAWVGHGDPVQWMMRTASGVYEPWGVRLALQFPNGRQVRCNARHDFHGHSMWNPAHGPMKAVQSGWRDHILTCGHKHTSFIGGPLKDPASGLLSWAIRCAGYKSIDRYANQEGLPDQNAFAAAVTIIDPRYDDDDTRLITVIPDVAEGAEFLRYKRRKK